MKIKTWQADLLLLTIAMIWGSTFILVKNAIADMPTFTFLAIRFSVATLGLAIFRPKLKFWSSKQLWHAGILIGLLLFGGYAFQTWGLQYTSAAKAGFITGLSVVLVPILVAVFDKKKPSKLTILGIIMAAIGLAFLSLQGFSINIGDFIVLLCAFCFAGHIYMVGKHSFKHDPIALTTIQIGTVALISSFLALTLEMNVSINFSPNVYWGLLITALPATSVAFLLQNSLQRFTSASHTALIFSSEPVFAYVFAFMLAGEILSMRYILGASLIMGGILLSELTAIKSNIPHPDKQLS